MELVRKRAKGAANPPIKDAGLAVLHNELARCHADLSVTAMRLILLMANQVRQDREFKPMRLRVADYQDKLQLSGKSAYLHLNQVILKLMQTILVTENPVEGEDVFQVLGPSTRIPGKGEFILRFNDQMRPLLLNLQRLFCKVPLEIFFRIQGAYAVRFYLVCKSLDPVNNRVNGWRMTVKELRDWLGIKPGQYEKTFHLRAAVIKRAQDELDRVADLSFRCEPLTEGGRTTGWTFIAIRNRPKLVSRQAPLRIEEIPEPTEEEKRRNLDLLAELKAQLKG